MIFLAVQASAVFAQVGKPCTKTGGECIDPKLECSAAKCQTEKGICVLAGKEFICPFSTYTSIEQVLKEVSNFLFTLAIVVCPLIIVIGAVMFLVSAGDPNRTRLGRSLITWAIIGLAVILSAKIFFALINRIILG